MIIRALPVLDRGEEPLVAVEESDGVDVGGGGGGGPPGDPLEGHVRVQARLVDAGLVTGRSCAARAPGNSRLGKKCEERRTSEDTIRVTNNLTSNNQT